MDDLERSEKLDSLGNFLMQQVRDVCVGRLDGVFDLSKSFSPADRRFQNTINKLNLEEDGEKLIRDIVTECIDHTISELLYSFECNDNELKRVSLNIDGADIRDLSKNLQGYLYSEWFEKFSQYGDQVID
jgi:hypothetical protein